VKVVGKKKRDDSEGGREPSGVGGARARKGGIKGGRGRGIRKNYDYRGRVWGAGGCFPTPRTVKAGV